MAFPVIARATAGCAIRARHTTPPCSEADSPQSLLTKDRDCSESIISETVCGVVDYSIVDKSELIESPQNKAAFLQTLVGSQERFYSWRRRQESSGRNSIRSSDY